MDTTKTDAGRPGRQNTNGEGVPGQEGASAGQSVAGVAPPACPLPPVDVHALSLRWSAAGCYLYGASAGVFPQVETVAFTKYMDGLRWAAGDATDPVEQMLIEQVALAHHAVGRLHIKASAAEGAVAAGVYLAAAARLTAEFRKTALALKDYRAPATAVPRAAAPGGREADAARGGPTGPRLLDELPDTELGGDAPEGGGDRAHRVA
jgi:hypothetical protein